MGKFSGGRKSVGRARVPQGPEKKQKYNRMRKIMPFERQWGQNAGMRLEIRALLFKAATC